MPQAVQVAAQAKQQGLANLHGQAAAWSACRELAFDRREDSLDQGTSPIELLRERPSHFCAHAVHAPGFLSTLGWNHASRSQPLTNVGGISLAVEFRVGQHHPNGRMLRSRFDHHGEIRAVVPRTAPGALRQQELLIQIGHDHPLQPMPPGQGLLPVVMQAAHKV